MENTKALVREVPFGKAMARITVKMYNPVIDLDGDVIVSKKVEKMVVVEIIAGGKVVSTGRDASKLEYNNLTEYFYKKANLDPKAVFTKVGDKALTPGFEAYENISAAIDEMEAELAAEFGVKTSKEKAREEKIAIAKDIMERAEKEGVGNLMTEAELKVWRRNYNNLYNEGGEGYIPTRISKEQFDWAMKVLAEDR